jgi:hypothetical protein
MEAQEHRADAQLQQQRLVSPTDSPIDEDQGAALLILFILASNMFFFSFLLI